MTVLEALVCIVHGKALFSRTNLFAIALWIVFQVSMNNFYFSYDLERMGPMKNVVFFWVITTGFDKSLYIFRFLYATSRISSL